MAFPAPVAAAAMSHNTLLRQAPIEVEMTIADPNTESAWFSLSAVTDMSKTLLTWPTVRMPDSATNRRDSWHVRLEIDDDNKRVRAVRNTGSLGADITIRTMCYEFMPWAIQKRYHGTISLGPSETTDFVTHDFAFSDFERVLPVHLGQTTDQNTQSRGETECALSYPSQSGDSGKIRTSRVMATGSCVVSYMAIQFSEGILQSGQVLHALPYIYSGQTSGAGAWFGNGFMTDPASFDESLTLFLYSNCYTQGGFQSQHPVMYYFSDSEALQERNQANSDAQIGIIMALPIRDKWAVSGEANVDRIASLATTKDVTLSTITDLARAMYSFTGQTTDNPFANIGRFPATIDLTSTTNLRLERGGAATNYVDVAYSVLQLR